MNTTITLSQLVQQLKAHNENDLDYELLDFVYDYTKNQNLQYLADQIAESGNIDVTNDDGITVLMFAAAFGLSGIAKLFIEAGANVNKQSKSGYTALMLAAEFVEHEIVELLINADANMFLMHGDETALMKAVKNSHVSIVRLLLKKGLQEKRHEELCIFRVSWGPGETIYVLRDSDFQINRALIYALDSRYIFKESDNKEIIKLLISVGCNLKNNKQGGVGILLYV